MVKRRIWMITAALGLSMLAACGNATGQETTGQTPGGSTGQSVSSEKATEAAGQDEVKTSGAKVVMKNNVAECVLLSPDEYVRLMDEVNDARLHAVAAERMSSFDPSALISEEEMDKKLGITEKELDSVGEVEFE